MAACSSSDSLFRVYVNVEEGGPWGYIDKTGTPVIAPQFYTAGEFSEGLASASRDYVKEGYIDTTGSFVIQPHYYGAGRFSEGLAAVQLEESGDYGYIDKTGTQVIAPQFYNAGLFSDGLAPVQLEEGGDYGYIDKTGALVIAPHFYWVGSFSDGLAPVPEGDDGEWGYIDKSGSWVIQPQFYFAREFSEGLALASVDGTSYGYIDKSGKFVIQPQYLDSYSFSEGLAPASLDGTSYGYIDKSSNFVIQPQYFYAYPFSDGLAYVALNEAAAWDGPGALEGYIDKTGKVIWQGQTGEADFYADGGEDMTASSGSAPPITEQEVKELAAPYFDTSAADVEAVMYGSDGDWSYAIVYPGWGEVSPEAVFHWTGGSWSLFWVQTYTITSEGTVEFEDPHTLGAQGVAQPVIEWLYLNGGFPYPDDWGDTTEDPEGAYIASMDFLVQILEDDDAALKDLADAINANSPAVPQWIVDQLEALPYSLRTEYARFTSLPMPTAYAASDVKLVEAIERMLDRIDATYKGALARQMGDFGEALTLFGVGSRAKDAYEQALRQFQSLAP
jgi:hypothetical protein